MPASIEVSPRQAVEFAELPGLFPAGTAVYLTDIAAAEDSALVAAARRLRDLGYEPVPHLAARRLATLSALERRVAAFAQEAGVRDVLVVGGDPAQPSGPFDSTLSVLETGTLDRHGIGRIGVAGHPGGSPAFDAQAAIEALRLKQAFARRTDADMRIVTQFGFDGDAVVRWTQSLAEQGIDLPVHVGVSGPASMTTLIRYATMVGIGNSVDFLRKQSGRLAALVAGPSPETVVGPVERRWQADPGGPIRQLHVFAFGGLKSAAAWLRERGSWSG